MRRTRESRMTEVLAAPQQDRELAIREAAARVAVDPAQSRVAAGLLASLIADEAALEGVTSFSSSIRLAHASGLLNDTTAWFVTANAPALDALVDHSADSLFEYFGLRTVYDRYLLRHPIT